MEQAYIFSVRNENGNIIPIPALIGPPGPALAVSNTAAVGQTVRIAAVDETGQPTEWEAVDMASGGSGNVSLPLLYDLTTEEEVRWIDTGDNAFEANSFVIVDLYSVATETNTSNTSGSGSIYPITSGVIQAPWNNFAIERQISGMLSYQNDKVFRAFCFRGKDGYWTSITSIREDVNTASTTPRMIATKLDGITDQPMRGIIIGDSSALSGTRVLGAGSRLRVWGI